MFELLWDSMAFRFLIMFAAWGVVLTIFFSSLKFFRFYERVVDSSYEMDSAEADIVDDSHTT